MKRAGPEQARSGAGKKIDHFPKGSKIRGKCVWLVIVTNKRMDLLNCLRTESDSDVPKGPWSPSAASELGWGAKFRVHASMANCSALLLLARIFQTHVTCIHLQFPLFLSF